MDDRLFTGVSSSVESAASFAQRQVDGILQSTTQTAQQALTDRLANTGKDLIGNIGGRGTLGAGDGLETAFDSGIDVGGRTSYPLGKAQQAGGSSGANMGSNGTDAEKDFRVKLRAQTSAISQVYGPNAPENILNPLYKTHGMLFPYTPIIDWSQNVEYKSVSLTHSNQDYYSYSNTPSTSIRVSGEFTVQNQFEGEYMLAVMHFLRTVSKMYFGKPINGYPSGMPPPVLLFSGYGNYMFNDLPVIVKEHSYSLSKDVDYLDVNFGGGNTARLPAILNVSLTLVVQNTPRKQREEFNLDKFRTGELMRGNKKGWI